VWVSYGSCLCLLAQEAGCSPPRCSGGARCAPSSLTPTASACCSPDSAMVSLSPFPFGMTFAALMADLGSGALTSYRVASPVKTSRQRAVAQASKASAPASGGRWPVLLGRFDPASCSLRTLPCSANEGCGESLVTLPRWGMMSDGVCWEVARWEFPMTETVSGSGVRFPTPTVHGNYNRRGASEKSGDGLATFVVRRVPTPTAHDAKDTGTAPSEGQRNTPCLAYQVGGKLNPPWVEWLMGWPVGWTDLKPLETDRSPLWPSLHGDCLRAWIKDVLARHAAKQASDTRRKR
jgi:hypothetical protein